MSRASKLEGWLPIEAIPGLYEELTEEQTRLSLEQNEIQMADEPTRAQRIRLIEANRQLRDLDMVKKQLGRIAPDEIAVSFSLEETLGEVPGIDQTRLYEK
jgi:CRISPR/Cas system-associated protein Csm6